ncbi:MAG: hypothetical protein AABW73_02615 [Nanoarchaeota archaeon]
MVNSLGFYEAADGLFRGHQIFFSLLSEGRLKPKQAIRVYDYGRDAKRENYYTLGPKKKLYGEGVVEVKPQEVLNGRDGWCFDGYSFERLPKKGIENKV